MTEIYYQGETVGLKATVKDADGTLTDPSTVTITIVDPTGTEKVTDSAMTKKSTGIYQYDYTIASDAVAGIWTSEVKATSGKPSIEQDTFRVITAL
jgi:uncharacterized protein YfaS (alpha-2-macroglobulin family)